MIKRLGASLGEEFGEEGGRFEAGEEVSSTVGVFVEFVVFNG